MHRVSGIRQQVRSPPESLHLLTGRRDLHPLDLIKKFYRLILIFLLFQTFPSAMTMSAMSDQNCTLYGSYPHESSSADSHVYVTHVTVASEGYLQP